MTLVRRTQSDRRSATRRAFLDAALEHLVEGGISAFVTPLISRRAGLSQGALFKHFPTKAELLAATTEHLFAQLRADYEARFLALPPAGRTLAASIDLLWEVMDDPRLAAAYEVFTAARTSPELQQALSPVVSSHAAHLRVMARSLFPGLVEVDPAAFDAVVEVAILAMQGLVLNQMAAADPEAKARLTRTLHELGVTALRAATGGRS